MVTRLQHLHDQRVSDKERFVCFCSTCVPRVEHDLGLAGETLNPVNGRCFGCGRAPEESTGCRLTEVPNEWSGIYLNAPRTVERKASFFRPASYYPHFSLGFPHLDSLLRPFVPGFAAVVMGAGGPRGDITQASRQRSKRQY